MKDAAGKPKPGRYSAFTATWAWAKPFFTQGFAKGLGIREPVTSPTFTIVQEYEEGRLPFYHFDVYRISDPEEMYEVGFDEYLESGGVCFIEWAGLIDEILPEERTEITIEKDLSRGFEYRLITRTERKREEERP